MVSTSRHHPPPVSRRATRHLRRRLAPHAPDRERHDLEARLSDRLAALAADAVAPGLDVLEGPVDLLELAGFALDHRRGHLVVVGQRRAAVRILEHVPALVGVPGRIHALVDGAAEGLALPLQLSFDRRGHRAVLLACTELAPSIALSVPT